MVCLHSFSDYLESLQKLSGSSAKTPKISDFPNDELDDSKNTSIKLPNFSEFCLVLFKSLTRSMLKNSEILEKVLLSLYFTHLDSMVCLNSFLDHLESFQK